MATSRPEPARSSTTGGGSTGRRSTITFVNWTFHGSLLLRLTSLVFFLVRTQPRPFRLLSHDKRIRTIHSTISDRARNEASTLLTNLLPMAWPTSARSRRWPSSYSANNSFGEPMCLPKAKRPEVSVHRTSERGALPYNGAMEHRRVPWGLAGMVRVGNGMINWRWLKKKK